SWSLVKMGTTVNQKKVFFNLRKAQSKISILDDGDMRLDQVQIIAQRIGVTETDVICMNRRLGGDASLNAAIREDGDSGEWQDWLVDESPDQETTLAAGEEFDNHESRRRQYGLVDRARQLGWTTGEVIDDDLGRSGGGIARPGFERLLAAICEARVGAVLAIEVSRLARKRP